MTARPQTGPAAAVEPEGYWYLNAITGVVGLIVGVLVLAYPDPSVKLVGVFLGVDLLIAAVALIVRATSSLAADGSGQGTLLLGLLALIAGVLVIRNPGESVALLALALAIWMIVAGALALADAIISSDRRMASLARGVVLAGAGTVIVSWPEISLDVLTVLAGIALCLQGLLDLIEAFAAGPARGRGARA